MNHNNFNSNSDTDPLLQHTHTHTHTPSSSYTIVHKSDQVPPSLTLHSTASAGSSSSSEEFEFSTPPPPSKMNYRGGGFINDDNNDDNNNHINGINHYHFNRTKRHPKTVDDDDDVVHSLHRHLSLFDLLSIGVAATVGSGIFVLCGLIARDYAGPSTFICWAIAGLSCCASGLCYAELGGKFAVSGSTYSYAVSVITTDYR